MEMLSKQHSNKLENNALLELSICNITTVYAIKAYQGVVVLLHALSTLTLGGREWSASPERKSLLVPPEQLPELPTSEFIYTS
jgi:hypothetical protein